MWKGAQERVRVTQGPGLWARTLWPKGLDLILMTLKNSGMFSEWGNIWILEKSYEEEDHSLEESQEGRETRVPWEVSGEVVEESSIRAKQ